MLVFVQGDTEGNWPLSLWQVQSERLLVVAAGEEKKTRRKEAVSEEKSAEVRSAIKRVRLDAGGGERCSCSLAN